MRAFLIAVIGYFGTKRLTESHSVIDSKTVQYFIDIFFKVFYISRFEFH